MIFYLQELNCCPAGGGDLPPAEAPPNPPKPLPELWKLEPKVAPPEPSAKEPKVAEGVFDDPKELADAPKAVLPLLPKLAAAPKAGAEPKAGADPKAGGEPKADGEPKPPLAGLLAGVALTAKP